MARQAQAAKIAGLEPQLWMGAHRLDVVDLRRWRLHALLCAGDAPRVLVDVRIATICQSAP